MNGYLVKHAVFGVGKIVDWSGTIRQPFKVRFYSKGFANNEMSFDKSSLSRQVNRTVLPPGSRCCSDRGGCVVVEISKFAAKDEPAEYRVEFEKDGGLRATVSEADLEPSAIAETRDPGLLLGGLQAGGYSQFRARERLTEVVHRMFREGNGLHALLSSRVDLRPHQAYVAGVVLLDRRRRYLLADEVGLGKTIEAGIIMSDLLCQHPDSSVLILTPGTLTQQWLCELYCKFGQHTFVMSDLHEGHSGTLNTNRLIVSLTSAGELIPLVMHRQWDMVIIDEAHHLLASLPLYRLAKELSERSTSLLLLSALPAQEREEEFLRLLTLLEPPRYEGMTANEFGCLYQVQQEIGRKIRLVTRRLDDLASGESEPQEALDKLAGLLQLPALADDETLRSAVDSLASIEDHEKFADQCKQLLHYVGDTYRINRRILRNRRERLAQDGQIHVVERRMNELTYIPDQLEIDATQAVHALLVSARSAPERLLVPLAGVFYQSMTHPPAAKAVLETLSKIRGKKSSPATELLWYGHLVGYEEWNQYLGALLRAAQPYCDEALIDAAIESVAAWNSDANTWTRLNELVKFLEGWRSSGGLGLHRKLLIFAGFYGVAADLAARLQAKFGNDDVAQFHHDLTREEKERNVTRFKIHPRTWILVCDETGGEGRNFQFASELVHFDTPWYAARVEQRIGRLDRLGREREANSLVVSNVLFNQWSAEAGLIACYRDGLGVYTRSLSGLEFALREVEQLLAKAAVENGSAALLQLVPQIKKRAIEERARDESDAVLDAASFERSAAEKYWRVSDSSETEAELEEAFIQYFKNVSSEKSVRPWVDDKSPVGVWKLTPSDIRHISLGLQPDPQSGVPKDRKGTFRRGIAQTRPDLDFFNVGNEFFDAIVASTTSESVGRTYAIECSIAGATRWIGFEIVVTPSPKSMGIAKKNIGLVNRARQVVHSRPVHVFVEADGTVAPEPLEQSLLQSRRDLKLEGKNIAWWNLTKEKSELMHRAFPSGGLQQAVAMAVAKACEVARQRLQSRLMRDIEEEGRRIDEMLRLAASDLQSAESNEERKALEDCRSAVNEWVVNLDSIGFLSVNGRLKP